jgi:hypothetical protein
MKKIMIILLLSWLLILLNIYVFAGGIGVIGDPIILPGIKHKILVLEYDNPIATTWGKDISQIIAQEILGTMIGIRSVGVVNLHQPEKRIVLIPENIEKIANDQKALIVIWGEFYSDDVNIYIHSHVRIIPSEDFPESGIGLTFMVREANFQTMRANPPTHQINFAPIQVSIATLNKLHYFYNQTITVRKEPSEDSDSVGELRPGSTYFVAERKGNWTKIVVSKGVTGWIRHSTLSSLSELREIKAVLKFTQGTLQFIAGSYLYLLTKPLTKNDNSGVTTDPV